MRRVSTLVSFVLCASLLGIGIAFGIAPPGTRPAEKRTQDGPAKAEKRFLPLDLKLHIHGHFSLADLEEIAKTVRRVDHSAFRSIEQNGENAFNVMTSEKSHQLKRTEKVFEIESSAPVIRG